MDEHGNDEIGDILLNDDGRTIVLTAQGWVQLMSLLDDAPPPTKLLRKLMKQARSGILAAPTRLNQTEFEFSRIRPDDKGEF